MSLEVKPVSKFLIYLAPNCMGWVRAHFPEKRQVIEPTCTRGEGISYEKDGYARRNFWNWPLKETNPGVAHAFLTPKRDLSELKIEALFFYISSHATLNETLKANETKIFRWPLAQKAAIISISQRSSKKVGCSWSYDRSGCGITKTTVVTCRLL